ncbi:CARDB domain-containing protein, partial [Ramlibacter sp. WS9]|uniref:CARDB domain-containing protein n=1 Tax=Ramlibacter sp. WS9 TaxID=1882741 RepID=UPI001E6379F5
MDITYTVTNRGTGAGRNEAWTDRIILSGDSVVGNGDDILVATKSHLGALAAGESYTETVHGLLPAYTTGRYQIFVIADSVADVFENGLEANNTAAAAQAVEVMPIPYADLKVKTVTVAGVNGEPASGKPLSITYSVANEGIGTTNTAEWSDRIWLSRDAAGTQVVAQFASASHIGALAVNDAYQRSVTVTVPEGLSGDFYVNVSTGGPFEFLHTGNNRTASAVVPITLSISPDLVVEQVNLPASANEGGLIELSWSVLNQGQAAASGRWTDQVVLIPVAGGAGVVLGSFTYDRGLEAGIRYARTEQVRLPARIEGQYRIRVVTNVDQGVYEHGDAKLNNVRASDGITDVSLNDRPDLRVSDVVVPGHVTAGGSLSVRYTVGNFGPAATSGRWVENVYLSQDGNLSGDDQLVGRFDNGSALAPTESYAVESASVNIPIRMRGDVYLIVVADGNNQIDEYPNEANNARAVKFYVDPVPFADLVTGSIVAPDQAVHGSSILVSYKVTNTGSAATRGASATQSSWTDTIWLTRDKTRPSPYKGDIFLGSVTHSGALDVGQDYLGSAQVNIPAALASGQYYITVFSDAYDVILEDSLAVNVNPDAPSDIDGSNFKARPISILGISPPDLAVTQTSALTPVAAGGSYTFSYSVQNKGDQFSGTWTDRVYVANAPTRAAATNVWTIGDYVQSRTLGNGEQYTVNQTLQLAPSVTGQYLIVESDAKGNIGELLESNNARSSESVVVAAAADLRVSVVTAQPENFSGEETNISWTVVNNGAAVWAGTNGWVDSVYFSPDPVFDIRRATALGSVVHTNVGGLAAGGSYTATLKAKLPAGTDGPYYVYVITDSAHPVESLGGTSSVPQWEELKNSLNSSALSVYRTSVYEGDNNINNMTRGTLQVTYREPDLQVGSIQLSDTTVGSGHPMTVTWTVTNHGTRATRVTGWADGVYLSRDPSLDGTDYPLVDRTTYFEIKSKVKVIDLGRNPDGSPHYLQPGESYTATTTFDVPESISGQFKVIVKADTSSVAGGYEASSIRDGLSPVDETGDGTGAVKEFQDEGNNIASTDLTVVLVSPPDLQVAAVTIPERVIAGQAFTVDYQVQNSGGATPAAQGSWSDLVYLSKDRFLDLSKDRFVGYVSHYGGLAESGSYTGHLNVTAPRDLEGAYYVFVVTDPANAFGAGANGNVREFGKDLNNSSAALQPIVIDTPPPADLQALNVIVPASAVTGQPVSISYTITNDSINPAFGNWTDAVYLSSDNNWDLGDVLLGKVNRSGGLAAGASYNAQLTAALPPLKDGNWRVIVRPDLYNEVFEGPITYTATGLNMAPGEANNRVASGATLAVTVPTLQVASPLATTLGTGDSKLYKVSVASGETLRISLDSSAAAGANEVYVRYGDIPTAYAFDASYSVPVAPDQQALIPTTQAGDYYVLIKSRQGAAGTPVTLRADLLPLSITSVTPDAGGTGDLNHRWVTFDIHGAHFKPDAIVKLSRPSVAEIEPTRWQVLDATHIRAVFDLHDAPHGLYDISVSNPDGATVTEAYRYLVDRGIEADVTIGIGGERLLSPGDRTTYSVSLQSLTNVDTPYVRFDIGAPNMGSNEYLLEGLNLPFLVFGSNVGGQPSGQSVDAAGNTQTYGPTPTTLPAKSVPWASLDGALNTSGFNLTPGYAFDLGAQGFAGASFTVQTYPGLSEWLAYDFEGLRDKLYAARPDWKAAGLLDAGVSGLNNISEGLAAKFLSTESDDHITKLEMLAMPFRFSVVGAATPITRDEFIADQTAHAKKLRAAILTDAAASSTLTTIAADEAQWVQGWLAALEQAGMLRPLEEAPPIRLNPSVISLNATLATGILFSKAGENYQSQADILGLFSQVQKWYGDTATWPSDPAAALAPIEYIQARTSDEGEVEIPVPAMANPADYDLHATQDTHFINFNVFAGGLSETEYIQRQAAGSSGVTALNLAQYLQQAAEQSALAAAVASIQGPRVNVADVSATTGEFYLPAGTALPYTIGFNNPSERAVGQLRIVTQLDPDLDARSLRLGDLKLGDINVHIPADKANFQGDFDFSGNKGFILRVSAGVDAEAHIATWLLQAIDPDTGEVLRDATRGLLAPLDPGATAANAEAAKRGFVSYTIASGEGAQSGASITAQASLTFDGAPPVATNTVSQKLDVGAPITTIAATALGNNAAGEPLIDVQWVARDDASGVKHVTVYVAENGGDFKIWLRQAPAEQTQAVFTGVTGKTYEFLAVATDKAGNREAATVANAVLPDDGSRQAVLDALGATESLNQTSELPLATPGRTYAANVLFTQAQQQLPGYIPVAQASQLASVVAPFTARTFADGFSGSAADVGALAMVQLSDGSVLASAGQGRNEVFRFAKDGGRSTQPVFTLDVPVMDMAVDGLDQLWVSTGAELLQVDAESGVVLRRMSGPSGLALTHALAIQPNTGDIYVSSGGGVEIFKPGESDPAKAWQHFSNERVSDLAFGSDGRLWAVRWSGRQVTAANPDGTTDIISFPMSGQKKGRAELEYRLAGSIDSIAFGHAGSPLDGLLLASSNLSQRAVAATGSETPHQAALWAISLQGRSVLQIARGGTRGETILATSDGRILLAESNGIDEVAPLKAPAVTGLSVANGALVPLPLGAIAVVFDQAMLADEGAAGSVLDPNNYELTLLGTNSDGTPADMVVTPNAVTWNAATRTALLDVAGLQAGSYQLRVSHELQSASGTPMVANVVSTFTAVVDMTAQVRLDFANTRAERSTGAVSYDVTVTNIGTDDLRGPMMLLLDPGRYFGDSVLGAAAGTGSQQELWVINLSAPLQANGNKLQPGGALPPQTITVVPASIFGGAGNAALAKFDLGHGVYAVPLENTPPEMSVVLQDGTLSFENELPPAAVGQPWTAVVEALDPDGTQFFWQIVEGPPGLQLLPPPPGEGVTAG